MDINGKKVVYVGIKLDVDSQHLAEKIAESFLPERKAFGFMPNHKIYCDHITLGFGDAVDTELLKVLGMGVQLHPHRILADEICLGIFFKESDMEKRGIPYRNEARPHLTLAMWNGIAPVHCGTVTERNHSVFIAYPTMSLKGRIGAFMEDGTWFFG